MKSLNSENSNLSIGFIGTGAIAEAFCQGLLDAAKFQGQILLSERNRERAQRLASSHDSVTVHENQEIVDKSDILILAVLPPQLKMVAEKLSFRKDQLIISLVAATKVEMLKRWCVPAKSIHRLIPMPPIEDGIGPIALYPPNSELENFLGSLGNVVAVEKEDHFDIMSAASSVMATFFAWAATVVEWMESQGFESDAATEYTSSLYKALSHMMSKEDAEGFKKLAEECVTKGGLNEQFLRYNRAFAFFDKTSIGLDQIKERIKNY